jgi:antitoxin VapB
MPREIEIKTERLAGLLNALHYKGVLLNGQHNFAWITGGASNGVDNSRDPGVASILVTDQGKRFIFANKIEMPRMLAEQISADDFEPIDFSWQHEKSDSQFVIRLASDLVAGQVVSDLLFDPGVPSIEGMIAKQRHSLTVREIERFRSLGRDAGTALDETISAISPGQTELEIASVMRTTLERYGIRSIVTLVAADDRIAKYRHPVPTANPWRNTILLVTCASRCGLVASLSRIGTIGAASSELIERTDAAAFVSATLWQSTREGVEGRELYDIAAKAYTDAGYEDEVDKHHQGGAAGYRTREWVAHPGCLERVQPNQAFAWNPSITGTKVEETVIAANGTCEVITASPGFPRITHSIGGVEYHSPGILEI